MTGKTKSFVVSALILVLISGSALYQFFIKPNELLGRLPEVDLSGTENRVRSKISELRNSVENNPLSSVTWGKYGINLFIHDRKEESIVCFETASSLDPHEFMWSYYCGLAYEETGSDPSEKYAKTRDIRDNYIPLEYRFANLLLNKGEIQKALVQFESIKNKEPNSPYGFIGLAECKLALGQPAEALKILEGVKNIFPGSRELRSLLSETYRELGNFSGALAESRMAEQLVTRKIYDPLYVEMIDEGVSSFWFQYRGDQYIRDGKYKLAEAEFQQALKEKHDAETLNNIGFTLQLQNKLHEASDYYQKALEIDPNYSEALNNYSVILFNDTNYSEAIAYAKKAVHLKPGLADGYLNLGSYYKKIGKLRKSLDMFQKGSGIQPADLRFKYQMAWLHAAAPFRFVRDGRRAVLFAEEVCELAGFEDPNTLDVLAAAYAENGNFKKAVKTAETALKKAGQQGKTGQISEIKKRMELYKSNKPYREIVNE